MQRPLPHTTIQVISFSHNKTIITTPYLLNTVQSLIGIPTLSIPLYVLFTTIPIQQPATDIHRSINTTTAVT